MFEIRQEPDMLAQLQKMFTGLAKVESWPLSDPRKDYNGARNYRYTDTSGNSYPVFMTPETANLPIQAVMNQIDANVARLTGKGVFIVRRHA